MVALGGILLLIHGVDMPRALHGLRDADVRWLAAALAVTCLSVSGTALIWGLLVRAAGVEMSWREVTAWSARSLFAGQLLPAGTGGDAVRGLAVGRMAGGGQALASIALARVCGALGMAMWGVAGAMLLAPALGPAVVAVACVVALALVISLVLALYADRVIRPLGRSRMAPLRRVHTWVTPFSTALSRYRMRMGLMIQCFLLGTAAWGLNLAAMVLLAHSVGIDAGWQVFAVTIPLTLTATLMPLSANGVGVREGLLVGLLVHAGVASGQAAALSILVDLQLVPIAIVGGIFWLAGGGAGILHREPHVVAEPVPVAAA